MYGPPTASDSPFYNKDLAKSFGYDPQKAKALLEEAGYRNGFDLKIGVYQGMTIYTTTAQIVQANLKKIGLKANINLLEWASFVERKNSGEYDIMVYGVSVKLPDPGAYSYYFGAESTYWAKPIGFRDDQLEELLKKGREATEISARKQIYHQVEKRLIEQSPWVFINWRETAQAYHNKVKGYKQLGGGLAELSPGIAMIFQEPMTALDPVYRIGTQIGEVLRVHRKLSRKEAFERATELMERVGISDPVNRRSAYPHELSGGMRQRVMIAAALACEPELIIADEPTTALDVTIQAQILDLINSMKNEADTSVLLITHDLGVVSQVADRVAVMYAGRIVEKAPVVGLFSAPAHPYTKGLLACLPDVDRELEGRRMLPTLQGTAPSPYAIPEGCRFRDRCPNAFERCTSEPDFVQADKDHVVRCWLYAN